MIEQRSNIQNNKQIKRVVEIDPSAKQITILDSRFYQRKPDVFYPSVTYVLNTFPKGMFFENWLKDVGHNSKFIVKKAAEEGTQVHNAIEDYLEGKEITWIDDYGNAKYSLDVWKMILKFTEFWNEYKPELIASEEHLFSDTLKVAGTTDLVLKIDGEIWMLDIKTSNSLHETYNLQLACYTKAWDECFDTSIQRRGVIWLKSSSRKADTSGKRMKGKGWEIKECPNTLEEDLEIFGNLYEIFKVNNSSLKPLSEIYPTSIKLNQE
ncbi:PD-(D/E)XK nuclease family protein [bacterium]|nr:PD-(D/E)XK nuclease family protein [bacterium]